MQPKSTQSQSGQSQVPQGGLIQEVAIGDILSSQMMNESQLPKKG